MSVGKQVDPPQEFWQLYMHFYQNSGRDVLCKLLFILLETSDGGGLPGHAVFEFNFIGTNSDRTHFHFPHDHRKVSANLFSPHLLH